MKIVRICASQIGLLVCVCVCIPRLQSLENICLETSLQAISLTHNQFLTVLDESLCHIIVEYNFFFESAAQISDFLSTRKDFDGFHLKITSDPLITRSHPSEQ
jgi:SURF4 family.